MRHTIICTVAILAACMSAAVAGDPSTSRTAQTTDPLWEMLARPVRAPADKRSTEFSCDPVKGSRDPHGPWLDEVSLTAHADDPCSAISSNVYSLDRFKDTAGLRAALKRLLGAAERSADCDAYALEQLRVWLLIRGEGDRSELVRRATAARDGHGEIEHARELAGLARLDPGRARPVIQNLVSHGEVRVRALALALQHRQSIADGDAKGASAQRAALVAIVNDEQAPGCARATASVGMLAAPWPGREDWYVARLREAKLLSLTDGAITYEPFILDPSDVDSGDWIPRLAPLVSHEDKNVREASLRSLTRIAEHAPTEQVRIDALRALLGWLDHPEWSACPDRVSAMLLLEDTWLPEARTGILAALTNGDPGERAVAAELLSLHPDRGAVASLKKDLSIEDDEGRRRPIIKAIVDCDGYTASDLAEAVESYATHLVASNHPPGHDLFEHLRLAVRHETPRSATVALGEYIHACAHDREDIAQLLVARAKHLDAARPAVARMIRRLLVDWTAPAANRLLLDRLSAGTADATAMESLLDRRVSIREKLREPLLALAPRGGSSGGVAAAVLEDVGLERAILEGKDREAQRALIVSARLAHLGLDTGHVAAFLKADSTPLADAARRYLESRDDLEARRALQVGLPDRIHITGAPLVPSVWEESRPRPPAPFDVYASVDDDERALTAEVASPAGPEEIFAILGSLGRVVIRIRGRAATAGTRSMQGVEIARPIPPAQVERLRGFVSTEKIDDLPGYGGQFSHVTFNGEYLHLTRREGRRVALHNFGPEAREKSRYHTLVALFRDVLRISYSTPGPTTCPRIPSATVLLSGSDARVESVWKQGADLRVLIGDTVKSPAGWHALAANGVGAEVAAPPCWRKGGQLREIPGEVLKLTDARGVMSVRGVTYIAGLTGLYRWHPGASPALVVQGRCDNPIVSPDGKWLAMSRPSGAAADPPSVAVVNLSNNRSFSVGIRPADTLEPLAFVSTVGKFLIYRAKDLFGGSYRAHGVGPEKPEMWLVDPATRAVAMAQGDLSPWESVKRREFQPTGRPDEVWASTCSFEFNATTIGRYDIKRFAFARVFEIDGAMVPTERMWVDASDGRVLLAAEGALLSVPLPTGATH